MLNIRHAHHSTARILVSEYVTSAVPIFPNALNK
jgi:hypothetical protein